MHIMLWMHIIINNIILITAFILVHIYLFNNIFISTFQSILRKQCPATTEYSSKLKMSYIGLNIYNLFGRLVNDTVFYSHIHTAESPTNSLTLFPGSVKKRKLNTCLTNHKDCKQKLYKYISLVIQNLFITSWACTHYTMPGYHHTIPQYIHQTQIGHHHSREGLLSILYTYTYHIRPGHGLMNYYTRTDHKSML